MSDNSRIEWTDASWNPVTGCTKVSPGCDHCYAERDFNRFNGPGAFDTVRLMPNRLVTPLKWRKPRRIFVNSMSDLFHDDVPDEYIAQVFAVMDATPRHTFQLLTKRHGRLRSLLSSSEFLAILDDARVALTPGCGDFVWPLPNVWLGVSVENQQWADIRIPALLDTPAAVRFLSCEPLIGPVSLRATSNAWGGYFIDRIDWVIVGGESGPGARPMHPAWARQLRDECADHEVAFHFKQWGEWAPSRGRVSDQLLMWPDGASRPDAGPPYLPPGWTNLERVGKKNASRGVPRARRRSREHRLHAGRVLIPGAAVELTASAPPTCRSTSAAQTWARGTSTASTNSRHVRSSVRSHGRSTQASKGTTVHVDGRHPPALLLEASCRSPLWCHAFGDAVDFTVNGRWPARQARR